MNETILLGYANERIEIIDMTISTFFEYKQAIKQKGYKAAMYFDGMYLYPTTGLQNPDCCWLHIEAMCGKDLLVHTKLLQKYAMTITIDLILNMYTRIIKSQRI